MTRIHQHKLGYASLVAAQCLTDSDAKFHMKSIPQFAKAGHQGTRKQREEDGKRTERR